jgi:ribonuclease BN (tRNA processing enzyme)
MQYNSMKQKIYLNSHFSGSTCNQANIKALILTHTSPHKLLVSYGMVLT